MRQVFRHIAIASAVGIMTLSAQGQPTSTTPSTTKTPDQAFSDYQAARDACGVRAGLAKSDCLRSARDDYERALNANGGIDPNMGGGQGGYGGASGASGGAAGGKANKS